MRDRELQPAPGTRKSPRGSGRPAPSPHPPCPGPAQPSPNAGNQAVVRPPRPASADPRRETSVEQRPNRWSSSPAAARRCSRRCSTPPDEVERRQADHGAARVRRALAGSAACTRHGARRIPQPPAVQDMGARRAPARGDRARRGRARQSRERPKPSPAGEVEHVPRPSTGVASSRSRSSCARTSTTI